MQTLKSLSTFSRQQKAVRRQLAQRANPAISAFSLVGFSARTLQNGVLVPRLASPSLRRAVGNGSSFLGA